MVEVSGDTQVPIQAMRIENAWVTPVATDRGVITLLDERVSNRLAP
jgi:hypothetical protein